MTLRTRASINSRRSVLISISQSWLSCSSGQDRISSIRRRAKTTLPAPIMAIRGMGISLLTINRPVSKLLHPSPAFRAVSRTPSPGRGHHVLLGIPALAISIPNYAHTKTIQRSLQTPLTFVMEPLFHSAVQNPFSRFRDSLPGVKYPCSCRAEEEEGRYEDDNEKNPGLSARVSHSEIPKSVIVEVQGINKRRICRSPIRHYVHLRKVLQ